MDPVLLMLLAGIPQCLMGVRPHSTNAADIHYIGYPKSEDFEKPVFDYSSFKKFGYSGFRFCVKPILGLILKKVSKYSMSS